MVNKAQLGFVDQLMDARGRNAKAYLAALDRMHQDDAAFKWLEAGVQHKTWARNWAMTRLQHVWSPDPRFPHPLENHLWAATESLRPIWGDNVPQIQWKAQYPRALGKEWLVNRIWRWITAQVDWDAWWASQYSLLPQTGVTAAKGGWDFTKPRGGAPWIRYVDQRTLYIGRGARFNHRTANRITIRHRRDVGELRSLFPEYADKIRTVTEERAGAARNQELSRGRESRSDSAVDPVTYAEICETWVRPTPDIEPIAETRMNNPAASAMDDPWFVITWLPGIGVVDEEERDGLAIGTAPLWENPDSPYGINDYDMVAGLSIAHDQLSIRRFQQLLRTFSSPLKKLIGSKIKRRDLGAREGSVWEFETQAEMDATKWERPPEPNADSLAMLADTPRKLREILGVDQMGPEALLQRQHTAAAIYAATEAVERKTRQKIRNAKPMAVDLAMTLMRETVRNLGTSIFVRESDGEQVEEIPFEMIRDLDIRDFIAQDATARSGPLTPAGKLTAWDRAIDRGLFMDPDTGAINLPIVAKKEYLDALQLPGAEAIKREWDMEEEARRRLAEEQAAMAAEAALAESMGAAAGPAPGGTAGAQGTPGAETPGAGPGALAEEAAAAARGVQGGEPGGARLEAILGGIGA